MSHLDRLSSLLSNFEVRSQRMPSPSGSNLFILGHAGVVDTLVLCTGVNVEPPLGAMAFAKVDIGGETSPLHLAMPSYAKMTLAENSEVKIIASLFAIEASESRCGGQFALDRLCDLIVLNILREQIEKKVQEPGMFAGLAHMKLRNVIVAMHDNPGQLWRVEDFAALAAMSRSKFMAEFQSVVGKSPMVYLKQWRMTLARIAIQKGDRIKEVAKRFGYSSGDAFCRAFIDTYGVPPSKIDTNDGNSKLPSFVSERL